MTSILAGFLRGQGSCSKLWNTYTYGKYVQQTIIMVAVEEAECVHYNRTHMPPHLVVFERKWCVVTYTSVTSSRNCCRQLCNQTEFCGSREARHTYIYIYIYIYHEPRQWVYKATIRLSHVFHHRPHVILLPHKFNHYMSFSHYLGYRRLATQGVALTTPFFEGKNTCKKCCENF